MDHRGIIKPLGAVAVLYLYRYIGRLHNEKEVHEEKLLFKLLGYSAIAPFGLLLRPKTNKKIKHSAAKAGILYYEFSRGIDLRPVEAVRIRKSVGCEHTLEKDISQQSSVIIELYHVATELIERLQRTGFKGNTLTLKIKFHDFNQKTRSITQSHELTTLAEILPLAKGLLKDIEYTTHPIRLIGLSVSNPYEKNEEKARWEQLSFEFSDWDYSK